MPSSTKPLLSQCSQYASVIQHSEYVRIYADWFLNISHVVKMPEWNANLPEYVWIYDNRKGFEYLSYNAQWRVTLQVDECLLRNEHIKNPAKDLR